MSDDEVTMSIRKFLKKVGITSQQEIEKVYSGAGKVKVKMILSSLKMGEKILIMPPLFFFMLRCYVKMSSVPFPPFRN